MLERGGGKRDKGVGDNQVRAVVFCTTIQLPDGTFLNLHCSRIQSVPDVYFRTYHTNLNTVCDELKRCSWYSRFIESFRLRNGSDICSNNNCIPIHPSHFLLSVVQSTQLHIAPLLSLLITANIV